LSAGTAPGALALVAKTSQLDLLFTNVDLKGKIAAGIELAQEAGQSQPESESALYHRTQSNRRHEGAFCQKLGFPPEAVHGRTITDDAVGAFPDQPAGASPTGQRVVDPARPILPPRSRRVAVACRAILIPDKN
jgi:hypothetical protein